MLKILVLSNNAVLQKLMRNLIGRWLPAARLVAAVDRQSALGMLDADFPPDIVVLEMSKPTRDELGFLREIRAAHSGASMIVLSSHPYLACYDDVIPKGIAGYFDIGSDTFVDDIHRCIVFFAEGGKPGDTRASPPG